MRATVGITPPAQPAPTPWRRWPLWTGAVLAVTAASAIAVLRHLDTTETAVLLGPFYDAQLTVFARSALAVGIGMLLLVLAAAVRRHFPRWPGRTAAGVLIAGVLIGWLLTAAMATFTLLWSLVWDWTKLDTPDDRHWAVAARVWHHTSYSLYVSDNGILYRRAGVMPGVDTGHPIGADYYRIDTADDGRLVLRYPEPESPYREPLYDGLPYTASVTLEP